jgi:CarD family transcriptional regulator
MEFSIGDRVVHPHHGPGQITGVERREFVEEAKRYYVIDIPGQELTLFVPLRTVEQVGIRPIMRRAKLLRVLDTLRGRPRRLPDDHKERQELVWEKLKTGRAMQMAEVVRDLTWQRERDHLTKRDAEYLQRGRDFLAAEMAFASETEVSEANDRIDDALESAIQGAALREQRRHQAP